MPDPTENPTADPETSVQFTIDVRAPIQRAFEVFTRGLDTWWPRDHHIGTVDMAAAILEPRAGGRWYEIGVDGSTCEWGLVLAWEPPHHVAVSWHLDGDFQYAAGQATASRVDVYFEQLDATTTSVLLVHSGLDRHGDSWKRLREAITRGWPKDLRLFAEAAAGAETPSSVDFVS